MFGKRSGSEPAIRIPAGADTRIPPAAMSTPSPANTDKIAPAPASVPVPRPAPKPADDRSEDYYQIKSTIFNALIDTIDLGQLAEIDAESRREEIRDIVNEIISIKAVVISIAEQEHLLQDICNDVLGYGLLEPLLARHDISDIIFNGAGLV